jgi:hypothetical protein
MKPRAALIALVLAVPACGTTTTPDAFRASDFFGEWRLEVAETACWETLSIAFAIDETSIEREGRGSMSFSSRWGAPTDSRRVRLVNGYISWNDPNVRTFQLAFFRSGTLLGELVQGTDGLSTDRLSGSFFDPDRQSCSAEAVALKVEP